MPLGLDVIFAGIVDAITLWNILWVASGVTLGILVGAIPGLNGPMAIALAVPATFYLEPITAIGFLVGIMKGSTVGGAVPAILMNTPGTPDAMVTTLDGYPLAQKGQSGKALKVAHLSSVTGDTVSDIVLFVAAAPLSVLAMMMGPAEQSAIVFFSICVLAALSHFADGPARACPRRRNGSTPRVAVSKVSLFPGAKRWNQAVGTYAMCGKASSPPPTPQKTGIMAPLRRRLSPRMASGSTI